MTPIKKKGGRHADQPVESAAPEQRQATQLGSPASLVGWTRRLCLAALHTQKARPSRPDLHEGLRLHRQIVPKLEVRSPALHPGGRSGCRRRNRHWQEEEAAGAVRLRCTSQEKERVSAPPAWSTVFCAPCGSALAGAHYWRTVAPPRPAAGAPETPGHPLALRAAFGLERGSQRPAQLLRAAFGLERTGQPSPLNLIAKRCRGGACPKESRQSRCLGNPGPPTPRHS
jgi:hypothetical protein